MNKSLLLVAGGALAAFTIIEIVKVVTKDNFSVEFTETVARHLREENKAMKERFDQDIKDLKDEIEMLKKSSK